MVIRKCDGCDNKINGNYWTIKICEKEDKAGKFSTEGMVNNIQESHKSIYGGEKEYCKSCIDEIKGKIFGESNKM